ncbi:MAG: acetate/propionate family kinase [Pseudomonadota bacterium]
MNAAELQPALLVVNAGSSSVKLAVFSEDHPAVPLLSAQLERLGSDQASGWFRVGSKQRELIEIDAMAGADHDSALRHVLPEIEQRIDVTIKAAGHRVVHGGPDFSTSVVIDDTVLEKLEALVPLARTHQPQSLSAIRAVGRIWPSIPQVASFDTAFHATIPEQARTFALPSDIRSAGVRRYGFHGLSYRWIAHCLPEHMGPAAEGRIIAAHLGNGASLCGMVGRESRATTMGFTPLDGLVMGERPGLTDPGAILFMLEELGLSVAELRGLLFKKSGLLGLSGLTNDMRTLSESDDPACRFAIEVYLHRIVREIGAIAAEIGGIDGLVFTGGVGENAAFVRQRVVEKLDWLGLTLDEQKNTSGAQYLNAPDHKPIAIIPANEESMIATEMLSVLGTTS